MDQLNSNPTDIIPIPDAFLIEPHPWIPHSIDEGEKLAITNFLHAYNQNPSQYGNKKPIDLIDQGWVENYETSLKLATKMGSAQLYQFIIDTGAVTEISNQQFITACFHQGEKLSFPFTQYIFDLCPNRINLVPPNILLSFLVRSYYDSSFSTLFWNRCPQLRNPNFLNSAIRMPSVHPWKLFEQTARCITDGGYDGDLSSKELGDQYEIPLQENNLHVINFLTSEKGSVSTLRLFVENSDISLAPLYRTINPTSDNQNGLTLLDDIPSSIEQIFCIPDVKSLPLYPEDVVWYLNWWRSDVLGDKMPLQQFKTFIFSLFNKPDSIYWTFSLPFIEYLGDEFFRTLSSDQIFNFLKAFLENTAPTTSLRNHGPDSTFPPIKTLLSFPSAANAIKPHCVYFTRAFLFKLCRWDCADLFLKLGGLTMEQIWSNHCCDDNKDNADVFTLETLVASLLNENRFLLPPDLVDWLSYQPGTQEQLIKIIKSKSPLVSNQWTDTPESIRPLVLFMNFSYHEQFRRQHLRQLQQELRQLQERFLPQLNPFPSSTPQSLSWLQSLIVYAPIDYMNVKLTIKLWKNCGGRSFIPFRAGLVTEQIPLGLCQIPILMNEVGVLGSPPLFLQDIIEGVIAALLINHQENADGQ